MMPYSDGAIQWWCHTVMVPYSDGAAQWELLDHCGSVVRPRMCCTERPFRCRKCCVVALCTPHTMCGCAPWGVRLVGGASWQVPALLPKQIANNVYHGHANQHAPSRSCCADALKGPSPNWQLQMSRGKPAASLGTLLRTRARQRRAAACCPLYSWLWLRIVPAAGGARDLQSGHAQACCGWRGGAAWQSPESVSQAPGLRAEGRVELCKSSVCYVLVSSRQLNLPSHRPCAFLEGQASLGTAGAPLLSCYII